MITTAIPVRHAVTPPARPGVAVAETSRALDALRRGAVARGDRSALFLSVYAPCVRRLAEAITARRLGDPATAERVVVALARRCIDALEGRDVGAWGMHQRLRINGSATDGRVLAEGFNAHLTVDLPAALREAGATGAFDGDLQEIGRILVEETARVVRSPADAFEERASGAILGTPALQDLTAIFGDRPVMGTAFSLLLREALAQSSLGVPALTRLAALHRSLVVAQWYR